MSMPIFNEEGLVATIETEGGAMPAAARTRATASPEPS
jgi:hypothetical protein